MEHQSHICVAKSSISGRNRTSRKQRKIIDKFKCGGCQSTFQTICVLHAHCSQHSTGSYFFDSSTGTAIPKYDNKCAYTQVNQELIELEFRNSSSEVAIQDANDSVEADHQLIKHETCVRQSKAISKENKICYASQTHVKDNGILNKSNEDKEKGTKNGVNIARLSSGSNEVSEPDYIVRINIKELLKTGIISKNTNENASKDTSMGEVEDIKDFNITSLDISPKTEVQHQSKKRYSQRNKNKHNDLLGKSNQIENLESQKTDELAASEALIAISEGVSTISEKQELSNAIEEIQRQLNKESDISASERVTRETETSFVDNQSITPRKRKNANQKKSEGKTQRPRGKNDGTAKSKDSKEEKTMKCPVCGKMGNQAMLKYHKYMHAETKEFTCETCGASFRTPLCLQAHQKQHTEKQFQCSVCSAAFHRKQYLRTHMMKHTGEFPFMCDFCGKSYREKNNLARHIRHVHEKVRKYECEICKEKFFRSDHLKNHLLRHNQASKKCPYCPRMFKHPDDLLRHTKTHTGEKRWHCHLCGHGFVSVSPYYVHMQKKHDIDREEATVLKNKLQAEHKKRLASAEPTDKPVIPVTHSTDTSQRETTRKRQKQNNTPPIHTIQVSSNISASVSVGQTYCDQNIAVAKPVLNTNISNLCTESDKVQTAVMEPCDNLIPINKEHQQEMVQYFSGFGNHHFIDGETVILEDGPCLDHYEIEIGQDEFGGGSMQSVMFVDGQQLPSEIVIQNI